MSDYNFNGDELFLVDHLEWPRPACPPLDILRAVGQEVLPPELEIPASAHLTRCPLCQTLLRDLGSTVPAALTTQEQQRIGLRLPLHSGKGSWHRAVWLPIAAAAAIAIVSLFAWQRSERAGRMQSTAQTAQPPAPPQVIAKLEIPLTPLAPPTGTTLLTRGTQSVEPSTESLLPAFTAYNHANYAAAAAKLSALQLSYPKSSVVPLYLGVSQLYLGSSQAADASLSLALRNSRAAGDAKFADAARWYSAISAQKVHPETSLTLLQALCSDKTSAYSQQSCALARSTAGHS